jgi:hypothetical protein
VCGLGARLQAAAPSRPGCLANPQRWRSTGYETSLELDSTTLDVLDAQCQLGNARIATVARCAIERSTSIRRRLHWTAAIACSPPAGSRLQRDGPPSGAMRGPTCARLLDNMPQCQLGSQVSRRRSLRVARPVAPLAVVHLGSGLLLGLAMARLLFGHACVAIKVA